VKAVSGVYTGEGVGPDGLTGISILFLILSILFRQREAREVKGCQAMIARLAWGYIISTNRGYRLTGLQAYKLTSLQPYNLTGPSVNDRGKERTMGNHGRVMARGCCACTCASSCVHTHSYALGHTCRLLDTPLHTPLTPQLPFPGL
jgi:hypothetical protein